MKRILLPALVVFVFGGCCASRQPPVDPFYGRTAVPPPGTGAIGPQPVRRILGSPGDRAGNVAAGVAATARRHDLALSSTPPAGSPVPGPGGYPGNPAGGGATYPGNSNGAIPYPSNGAAAPYPNGGGASINSPGRWPNAWTSATSNAPGDVVRIPASTRSGQWRVHRLRRSIAAGKLPAASYNCIVSFRIASAGSLRRGQHFRHDSGALSRGRHGGKPLATGSLGRASRESFGLGAGIAAAVRRATPQAEPLLALSRQERPGLSRLLVEAYALVREAARRTINMRHFDVQILGGIAMFHRSVVEMQTGEGKTLAATLPMYLYALSGKGCHLATVNDYLARRDAEWMGPIYEALGLTVGVVETKMGQPQRRKAYACDVTYGTAKEFGFDFLRDRLLLRRISEGQGDFFGGMLGHSRGGEGKRPSRGRPISRWSTKPTASSSTRPARR